MSDKEKRVKRRAAERAARRKKRRPLAIKLPAPQMKIKNEGK